MTVEELLKRYPGYKASLKAKEIEIYAKRHNILDSTGAGLSERVQSSTIGDGTSNKAIKLIESTELLEKEKEIYKLKVDLIENALSVLNEREAEVIDRVIFKEQIYSKVDYEMRVPVDTCKKIKRRALEKLKPYVQILL